MKEPYFDIFFTMFRSFIRSLRSQRLKSFNDLQKLVTIFEKK
jgi:hypothetical protein